MVKSLRQFARNLSSSDGWGGRHRSVQPLCQPVLPYVENLCGTRLRNAQACDRTLAQVVRFSRSRISFPVLKNGKIFLSTET